MKNSECEMRDLAFGIGDNLYNMLCDDCIDHLYEIGVRAVKASGFVISIEYDDNTENGEWMFVVDVSNSTQALHTLAFAYETLDAAMAFIEGVEMGATLKDRGLGI